MKIEIEIPDDVDIEGIYRKVVAGHAANEPRYLAWDELEPIYDAYSYVVKQNGHLDLLLYTHNLIEREFVSGIRCSVCGMTTEQAAAIGYDCAREC